MDLEPGRQYLWHGVTWASGAPSLLLADVTTSELRAVDVMGLRVGLKAVGTTRFCTGRYGFADTFHVKPVPCPQQARAEAGGQCAACLDKDEFRFAHHAHRGGRAPAALTAYLAQPHLLYIATFAHAGSKVGTAAQARRTSRLDEQGPMHATYLTQAPDGRAVRLLEDAVSRELGLAQTARGTAKLAALAAPDPDRARTAHQDTVDRALTALAGMGVDTRPQAWTPPAPGMEIRSPEPQEERTMYPHDLREGEHGFRIVSCSGSHVLVQQAPGDDVRYVLDLNVLKGRRVMIGDYASPAITLQGSLF